MTLNPESWKSSQYGNIVAMKSDEYGRTYGVPPNSYGRGLNDPSTPKETISK
jgi:hypothetical protein